MATTQPDQPALDTDPSLATDRDADALPRVPRRHLPTMRAIVITATVLAVLDGVLLRASGATLVRAILGGLLMGAFVVFAMRTIVRLRLRYRPEHTAPESRDPSAPPPRGGWATQTAGQSLVARVGRTVAAMRRPKPPRPRR